jgi:hypothetical protein
MRNSKRRGDGNGVPQMTRLPKPKSPVLTGHNSRASIAKLLRPTEIEDGTGGEQRRSTGTI